MLDIFLHHAEKWIDAGFPEHKVFKRETPIWDTMSHWLYWNTGLGPSAFHERLHRMFLDLHRLYAAEGRDPHHPFTLSGPSGVPGVLTNLWDDPELVLFVKKHARKEGM